MRNCLIILLMLAVFSGCAGKTETTLYDYKTAYIGDNSKVSHIVGAMQYPKGAKCETIKIQSEKEPYGLTVYLSGAGIPDAASYQKNALMCFALIGNLEEIKYQNSESGAVLAEFSRTKMDQEQRQNGQKTSEEIGKSKESFEAFQKL